MMLCELGLNPKKVGNDNGNGLGLGKAPRCAITGKPSNPTLLNPTMHAAH